MAALIAVAACCLPFRAAAASADPAWKPAWSTDFSGSRLPSQCGTYGSTYVGNAWSADEVSVSGGLLRVGLERKASQGKQYTAGGVGCWNAEQSYGRYEWRAKVPKGAGIDSYAVLWSPTDSETAWTGIEILAPGPETAHLTNGFGAGKDGTTAKGSFSDGFHTYVIEWAPGLIRISKDGAQLYRSTKSFSGKRWIGFVVSNGDNLTGLPNAATPLPAQFQIDSLKVSSYAGTAAASTTASTSTAKPAAGRPPSSTAPTRSPRPTTTSLTTTTVASVTATASAGAALTSTGAGASVESRQSLDARRTADEPGGIGLFPLILIGVLAATVIAGLMRAARLGPWSPRRGRHSD